MDPQEFRRAFHHGRWLVLIVAVGTALILLGGSAHAYWSGGVRAFDGSQVVAALFSLLTCWWLFQGGRITAGCIGTVYGLFVIGSLAVAWHGMHSWGEGLMVFFFGGWAAFSLWALAISKDVRVYQEARRLAISADGTDLFPWPPAGRRR